MSHTIYANKHVLKIVIPELMEVGYNLNVDDFIYILTNMILCSTCPCTISIYDIQRKNGPPDVNIRKYTVIETPILNHCCIAVHNLVMNVVSVIKRFDICGDVEISISGRK